MQVKASPCKKRRANGPAKKPAGSGASLLTQTSVGYQHPSLQQQASTDTKDEAEGVIGIQSGRPDLLLQSLPPRALNTPAMQGFVSLNTNTGIAPTTLALSHSQDASVREGESETPSKNQGSSTPKRVQSSVEESITTEDTISLSDMASSESKSPA